MVICTACKVEFDDEFAQRAPVEWSRCIPPDTYCGECYARIVNRKMTEVLVEYQSRAEAAEECIEVLNVTLNARGIRLELLSTRAEAAEKQLAEAQGQIQLLWKSLEIAQEENTGISKALASCEGKEWIMISREQPVWVCPYCKEDKRDGHMPDCKNNKDGGPLPHRAA